MKLLFLFLCVLFVATNALSFGNDLGGNLGDAVANPLLSAIEAQGRSARIAAEFLFSLGFGNLNTTTNETLIDFGNRTTRNYTALLPFLALVPVPYIQVREISVNFSLHLHSVDSKPPTEENKEDSNPFSRTYGPVNIKAGLVTKETSKKTQHGEAHGDIGIKIKAGAVELPLGTKRVLDKLESLVEEREE